MRDPAAQQLAQKAYKAFQRGELLLAETLTQQALARTGKNGDALAMMSLSSAPASRKMRKRLT